MVLQLFKQQTMNCSLSLVSKYSNQSTHSSKKIATLSSNITHIHHQYRYNPQASVLNQRSPIQKKRNLQKRIQIIKKSQQQLQQKCLKIIQNLQFQIKAKDNYNIELQQQIQNLTQKLDSSKLDLQVITNYMRRQKAKSQNRKKLESSKSQQLRTLDSTKESGQIQKSANISIVLSDWKDKSEQAFLRNSLGSKQFKRFPIRHHKPNMFCI